MALWYTGTLECIINNVVVKRFSHALKLVQSGAEWPIPGGAGARITGQYDFYTSRVETPSYCGSLLFTPWLGVPAITELPKYMPGVKIELFTTTNPYKMRFALPSGYYFVQDGSYTTIYDAENNILATGRMNLIYSNYNYTGDPATNNIGVSQILYTSAENTQITALNCVVQADYRPQSNAVYYTAWAFSNDLSNALLTMLNSVRPTPSEPSENPYEAGGASGPGGGGGQYVMNYDSVPFPELPALSAVNTGFASIWVPELKEVQALATYMWNCDPTTLDFWKKLAADPLDLILGFYIFPVQLTPDGAENVTIGIINTGVSMHYRNSQYVDVDCGTVQLDEYWKAYLDYSPYTRLSIYLPYIGVRPLDIDDVMGRSITLRYRIDLASGACVAMLRVDGSETEQDREAVLYQFTGFCATQIPVTSVQMGDLVRSTVSLVASIAGAVTGGASLGDVASSAANLATTKPDIAHSGAIGSAAGLMGVQRPYLIIERPRQAVPEEQQHYTGFPSFITEELSELEGYTEVEAVHLHDLGCTENEAREIERLLMEGVIF